MVYAARVAMVYTVYILMKGSIVATSVVSGRVDEKIRHRADAAIRNAGLTPNLVIQGIWRSIAETGEIPAAALSPSASQSSSSALDQLDSFLAALPPVNIEFANSSDDEILATKALDYA